MTGTAGPLQGVRIIEVADYVFVPAAAGILSDWGADVIKIEHHETGDLMRGLRTAHPGTPPDLPFNVAMEAANRGKRSLGLNLASEEGRSVLYALVKNADVFLTSKLTQTRQKLRIDVEHIRKHSPDIIYARGTGRGVQGAGAADGGFDALDFWYRSGIAMAAKPQEVDAPPAMPGGAFGDNTGAMYVAGGIGVALFARSRTGVAPVLDVSLLGAGMWTFSTGIALSALFGTPVEQRPSSVRSNPMIANYRTSDDRFIAVCCLQGYRHFPDLARVLGLVDLAADPRFSSYESFMANAEDLGELFADSFGRLTYVEALARLGTFAGQWAPVQNSVEVASDEQVMANEYIGTMTTSTGEKIQAVRPPVRFDADPVKLGNSPSFNEHGYEVLSELGLSDEEIMQLKVIGAVS